MDVILYLNVVMVVIYLVVWSIWMFFFCRYILVILYFNENIKREIQLFKDGKEYICVIYLKFKLGEEVVREVVCFLIYSELI